MWPPPGRSRPSWARGEAAVDVGPPHAAVDVAPGDAAVDVGPPG